MSQSCGRCKCKFDTIEEYDLHLVGCVLRVRMFRHQQYRERQSRDPLMRQRAVMRKPDYHPAERAQMALENEADIIDAGLRTGRIQSEPPELFIPTIGNRFKKAWRRIRGQT